MRLLLLPIALYPFLATAILRFKFQQFFPKFRDYFLEASSRCGPELTRYWNNNKTLCRAPCACAADCMLDDLPGSMQSNLASAAVLLGLIPPLLVFIGPSLADMAVLSLYDLPLAVLLALASPAVNLFRLFGHEDPVDDVKKPSSITFRRFDAWLDENPVYRPAVSGLKWFMAIAALVNNVVNSVYLDLRTVAGWRCSARMLPLVWSLFALVVHSFAFVAVRLRRYETEKREESGSWWRRSKSLPGSRPTAVSECLMWAGSVCAIGHMVLGIFDLSSLLFISADDALPVVVRYLANALVCQLILLMEVASMRSRLNLTPTEMKRNGPVLRKMIVATTKTGTRGRSEDHRLGPTRGDEVSRQEPHHSS